MGTGRRGRGTGRSGGARRAHQRDKAFLCLAGTKLPGGHRLQKLVGPGALLGQELPEHVDTIRLGRRCRVGLALSWLVVTLRRACAGIHSGSMTAAATRCKMGGYVRMAPNWGWNTSANAGGRRAIAACSCLALLLLTIDARARSRALPFHRLARYCSHLLSLATHCGTFPLSASSPALSALALGLLLPRRATVNTQVSSHSVRVNGADLAYATQGRGTAVVFVHGSLSDYRSWHAQMAPFAERYRLVVYSRRYHWPNAQPSAADIYAVAQHASDLGALIEMLSQGPAHIIGSSYGAMTALTLAVARPELVRSLVLGEPPLMPWLTRLPGGTTMLDAFLATAFWPAGQAFARGDAETGVRTFINGVVGPGAFDRLPPQVQGMMLDNAPEMRIETATPPEQYFPALSTADIERLNMPVLLVQGEASPPIFGPITEELACLLPEKERVTIAAASHGMHAQNPAAYNEAVLAFLAKH